LFEPQAINGLARLKYGSGMQARKQAKPFTLNTILGEQGMAIPPANYIDATHCFKNNSRQSEQSTRQTPVR
jgi:hypothetical protein